MNEAAKLVTASILGHEFKTFALGGKYYTMRRPSIRVMCRAITHFAEVKLENEHTELTVLGDVPRNAPHLIGGIAALLVGDVPFAQMRSWFLAHRLKRATVTELLGTMKTSVEIMQGRDFFEAATLAMEVAKIAARPQETKPSPGK